MIDSSATLDGTEDNDMNQENHIPDGSLITTRLLTKPIRGFLNGGEKRLFFSEIHRELAGLGVKTEDLLEKINSLRLELRPPSSEQMHQIPNVGKTKEELLIRQTDAERLFGAVILKRNIFSESQRTKNSFKVCHLHCEVEFIYHLCL